MTRTRSPETPTVDQNIQTATPDAENVVDHATNATEDAPGHQSLHEEGRGAETGTGIETENTDVDDHAMIRAHDEDRARTMEMEMINGSQNVVL
jgi:hypothetical protein